MRFLLCAAVTAAVIATPSPADAGPNNELVTPGCVTKQELRGGHGVPDGQVRRATLERRWDVVGQGIATDGIYGHDGDDTFALGHRRRIDVLRYRLCGYSVNDGNVYLGYRNDLPGEDAVWMMLWTYVDEVESVTYPYGDPVIYTVGQTRGG